MEGDNFQELFLDDGFKIKRKSTNNMNEESLNIQALRKTQSMNDDSLVVLKVAEMNVNKVYDKILQQAYSDDKVFQAIKAMISSANRSLVRPDHQDREAAVHQEEVVPSQDCQPL